MKRWWIWISLIAAVCAVSFFLPEKEEIQQPQVETVAATQTISVEETKPFDTTVALRVLTEDGVIELCLQDYLIGALVAEMPSAFPLEAQKAQAVASRTFALRMARTGKHENADVCTNPACCQGWCAEGNDEAISTAAEAVDATDGLVVTYEDALIEATFFSCSGGRTEAAQAVWGTDVPYLRSVSSPGEETAPRYSDSRTLTGAEFAQIVTAAYPDVNLSGSPKSWLGAISKTAGGGIDTVFIGGVPISGTSLRHLLSLRSTQITITATETEITFDTLGFGHRVGMSQYGARAMAEEGANFAEILIHYYQGAQIKKLLRKPEQPDI